MSKKHKNAYYNKNLSDAQREFEENMHKRNADTSQNTSPTKKPQEPPLNLDKKKTSSANSIPPPESVSNRKVVSDSPIKGHQPGKIYTRTENNGTQSIGSLVQHERSETTPVQTEKKDGYFNSNVTDAQRDFDEKMKRREPEPEKVSSPIKVSRSESYSEMNKQRLDSGIVNDAIQHRSPIPEERTSGTKNSTPEGSGKDENYVSGLNRKEAGFGTDYKSSHLNGDYNRKEDNNKGYSGFSNKESSYPDPSLKNDASQGHSTAQSSSSNNNRNTAGGYFNQNVKDAQKDYDKSFHQKGGGSGPSDPGSTQSGGGHVPPSGKTQTQAATSNYLVGASAPGSSIGKMQINGKAPTSIGSKIARIERIALKTGFKFAVTTATAGSDAGAGLQFTTEAGAAVAETVVTNAKITMSNGMNSVMNKNLTELGEKLIFAQENGVLRCSDLSLQRITMLRLNSQKDIDKVIQSINEILKANGYAPIIASSGKLGYVNVLKHLHRNKEIPADIMELYKTLGSLYQNKYMMKTGTRFSAIKRFSLSYIQKYLQQCDAGRGLAFSAMFVRRAANTLRYGLSFVRTTAKTARFATLTAAKAAAWAAAKAAQTKLGAAVVAGAKNVGGAIVGNVIPKPVKKVAKKTARGAKKGHNLFRNALNKFNHFRKDPFHINSGLLRAKGWAGNKFANSKLGRKLKKPINFLGKVVSPFNFVKGFIGKIIAILSTIISTIFSILLLGIAIIFICLIIVMIAASVVSSIVSLFDFSASEEEIRDAALNQIKSCYESQNNQISSMYSAYRNVSVIYKDLKDEEAYKENVPDSSFTETTNSAEILSMAMVYFDFDLEDAGKKEVTDYVRKLYNGSHTTSVITHTYTYWVDEDTVETYTDAEVTLTTYYFNDLFNCKLKDNFGTLSGSNVAEQVWNYFISAGFSPEATAGIMGNLYQESHMDPSAIQNNGAGPAAGICQTETYQDYNSRWGQMAKLAESRGKDWTDLLSQLDFMISDMPSQFDAYTGLSPHYYANGEWCWWPEKLTLDTYKSLTDVNKATEIFERVFLRGSITRMSQRYESANSYYDMYKNMTPGTDVQQKIVNAAYSQIGVNYVYGGSTPYVGLDCSGLTQYCYAQAGITNVPRTSQEQAAQGKVVTNPEPGDICVSNNAGHVAIYIGNGQMIEAPDIGQKVKISNVRAEKFVRFW